MRYDGTEKEIEVNNSILHINKKFEVRPTIYFGELKVELTLTQAVKLGDDLLAAAERAQEALDDPVEALKKVGWTFEDDGTMTIRGRHNA